MSDVPAAACWMAAWAMTLRPGAGAAAASGLLATIAVMTRPNLVPLAAVIGLTWLWTSAAINRWRTWQIRKAVIFGACAAIGPLLVAWSQAVFYGGVATSGYPRAEAFFRLSYFWPNLTTYPDLFLQVHGTLPLLGLLALPLVVWRIDVFSSRARSMVLTGFVMAVANVAAYLFYLPYDTAFFLRYFLVTISVLLLLYAAVVAAVAKWLWSRRVGAWAVPLLVVGALWPAVRRPDITRFLLGERRSFERIQLMGHYLEAALPRNAVALAFYHTGALSNYAHCNVVRLDLIDPTALDRTIADLTAAGTPPVFVIDELLEQAQFLERFKGSRFGALDWPPRAEFVTTSRIRYWLAADRDRHLAGQRWATDILR